MLQGYTFDEYMNCFDMYTRAGVDLARQRLVGLGSVCKRQATAFVADLVHELHGRGLKIHAFGLKIEGLRKCSRWLESADSMAWSYKGRRHKPCPKSNRVSCANCWHFARKWHGKVIRAVCEGVRAGVHATPSMFPERLAKRAEVTQ